METPVSIKFIWVLSALFVIGAIGNIFGFWGQRSWPEALFGFSIATLLFYYGLFFRSQIHQARQFNSWLVENRDGLRSGTVLYRDIMVSKDTEVTQYLMVLSLIKVSLPMYSRPFIKSKEDGQAFWTSMMFTLGSLLAGWWEFPWGPINTARAVYLNLRGGKRETIGALLETLSPSRDQWVFIHFKVSTGSVQLESDKREIRLLLIEISRLVREKRVGAFEGQRLENNENVLRFHGPDADRLFDVLERPLRKSPFGRKSLAIKRYGPLEGSTAREIKIDLNIETSNSAEGAGFITGS